MTLIVGVIPIDRTDTVVKKTLPGFGAVRIVGVAELVRHFQVKPGVAVAQRLRHMVVLVEIVGVHAVGVELQGDGGTNLPYDVPDGDDGGNGHEQGEGRALANGGRIKRHLPQTRIRSP